MKVLIINPPAENTIPEFPDEKNKDYLEASDFGFFPSLGPLYVLTYLEKNTTGHELHFKDCPAERIAHSDLADVLCKIQPDIIGFTSFTISMVDVCMAARTARDICPEAHLCLGGHHPIAFPIEAAQLKEFDSIIVGEGEIPFTQLVNALSQREDFSDIYGLYTSQTVAQYKAQPYNDGKFLGSVRLPPAYTEDIDRIPIPNRKYIRHIPYQSILGRTSHFTTIISSRGCPYRCIYCDVPFKRYRKRSVKNIIDEIEMGIKMGYQEFRFYDDLFNITAERVIEFCDEVDKRGLKFHWDFRGRLDSITDESIKRAKQSGCRMISFGVETGTDEGLKYLKKGINVDKIIKGFKICQKYGIITDANFIIGMPFEKTVEDVKNNLRFLLKIDPDYIFINILMLLPNTELFDIGVKHSITSYEKWGNFSMNPTRSFCIDHWEEHLSIRQLVDLQKWGYRHFYFRIRYILRSLLRTRSLYEFRSKLKGVLRLLF